ncbi:MAG: ABC transporter permease [Clostridia bacterium]
MNGIVELFFREWRAIFKNRSILLVMLFVPVMYFTLFGGLYSEKKVTDIPVAVVDSDQTELSRELIRAFDIDQTFAVRAIVPNEQELMGLIDTGAVNVGVIIPSGLYEQAKNGKEAEVMTIIDGSNMMISNTAVRAANTVVKSISAGVTLKKLEAKGEWGQEGKNFYTGIDYRYRVLYNPTFSYLSFMVFGLGGTVLQQVLFLGVALAIAREKEEGTLPSLMQTYSFPQLVFGKLAPYFLLSTFNLLVSFSILLKGFKVPVYGDLSLLLLAGVIFNIAVLSIGFAISYLTKDQLQATQLAMLIAVPSFMLSGFTWPITSMPPVIAGIGESLPLTYFLHALREVLTKGHGLESIRGDLAVLLLMSAIGMFLSYLGYLWQTRKNTATEAEQVKTA